MASEEADLTRLAFLRIGSEIAHRHLFDHPLAQGRNPAGGRNEVTAPIGIRMALGAQRANILGMVLREVLLLVGIGVVLGIAGSFATARLAQATVSDLL